MRRTLDTTIYHRVLRVSLLVCVTVLLFDSGILNERTKDLSRGAQQYVASAVGVRVGVAPTDVNLLTARITELETTLAQKDREIEVALNTKEESPLGMETSTVILSSILFILLILICINYVLDYSRYRRAGYRIEEVTT
jgi:hypothetical protein